MPLSGVQLLLSRDELRNHIAPVLGYLIGSQEAQLMQGSEIIKHPRSIQCAFTLIELLVGISLIVLLLALLLPAL